MTEPLTGRQTELMFLQNQLAMTGESGRTLLVKGPAGIGKTRLIRHFLELQDPTVVESLSGSAYLPLDNLLYAPILEAFGAFFQSQTQEVRKQLVEGLNDLKHLFPGLECEDPHPIQDADLKKIRLFQCFAQSLHRISKQKKVIVFLDDLHWADAVTMELFHYLSNIAGQSPVLLITTLRTEALQESQSFRKYIHSLTRLPQTHQLTLEPFDGQDIDELFQRQIGGPASPELLQQLEHQTSGSPLFLCALLDTLESEERLFFDGRYWNLLEHDWPLPPTLRDLVLERLERFTSEEQALLEWLAVCPDGLSHTLLSRAANQPEDALLSHIKRLCAPGFLRESLRHGKPHYQWTHPLVREVIYSEILGVVRHRLHASLASIFEEQSPDDLYHLANHYCGMDPSAIHQNALQVLQKAGEEAKTLGAHQEASRFFTTALEAARLGSHTELLPYLLKHLGEVKRLQGKTKEAIQLLEEALVEFTAQQQWRGSAQAHLQLAHIHWAQLAFAQAHQSLEQGLAALAQEGICPEWEKLQATRLVFLDRCYDFAPLRQLLQEFASSSEQQSPDFRLAIAACELGFQMREGNYVQAQQTIATMIPLAAETQDFAQMIRARNFAGLFANSMGDQVTSEEHFLVNISLIKEHDLAGCEPSVLCMGAAISLLTGNWEVGLQRTQRGIQIAAQVNSTRYNSRLRSLQGCLLALQGRFTEAQEQFQEAYRIMKGRTDDIHIAATIWLMEAVYYLELGQYEQALEMLQRTPAQPDGIVVDSILSTPYLLTWGHVQLALGHLQELHPVIQSLRLRGQNSEYCSTWADYFHAQQLHAQGETEKASDIMLAVANTFAHLQHPFAEAQVWLAWFRCQEPQPSSRPDIEWLQRADRMVGLFRTLSSQHRLKQAWEALANHSITKATLRNEHRYLSRREAEITELIAKGLKNTEIAKRLHISPHTVSSHLKRIYARLNVNSRTELVHFIMTHKL